MAIAHDYAKVKLEMLELPAWKILKKMKRLLPYWKKKRSLRC